MSRVPETREMIGQFSIPACTDCGKDAVRFRKTWVCRFCFKILVQAMAGWVPEKVSLVVQFPNRAARRAA